MPTEQLILRRVFPVPVTFSDLRLAFAGIYFSGIEKETMTRWHAAIKEATGALDEVYAVIDGREVRIGAVPTSAPLDASFAESHARAAEHVTDLLIKADEAGYWQRPHEVRHVLEEPMMSHKTMTRIAGNSFIAAGGK